MKDNAQITLANYNGNARPGELVVDQATSTVYVGNALGDLTAVASPGGATTWALLGEKDGEAGPVTIALGQDAGQGGQAMSAIALGQYAGQSGQGVAAISIGLYASGNDTGNVTPQGVYAVAIGSGAGYDAQREFSVAVGASAGSLNQGICAVAIGNAAGVSNQGNNSIIINATGANLNQTTANTFTVKPVRNGGSSGLPAGFYQMAYDPTTGEIVYYT